MTTTPISESQLDQLISALTDMKKELDLMIENFPQEDCTDAVELEAARKNLSELTNKFKIKAASLESFKNS